MDNKLNKDTLKALSDKGLNTDVYLEGIQSAKPLTYWDYIQPEALLNLQVQRTDLPDEMVFIVYHQINELLFKMILWEIEQLAFCKKLTTKFFSDRLERISRYFDMLCSSFRIMKDGMDLEQYMKFRKTLAPASGEKPTTKESGAPPWPSMCARWLSTASAQYESRGCILSSGSGKGCGTR